MIRAKRLALAATVAAIALPGLAAAEASADQIVTPSPFDFGALPIGTPSATASFTLTVNCDTTKPACPAQPYNTSFSSSRPDFTVANVDCPALMPGTAADMTGTSCTFTVQFTPVAVGPMGAQISTGTFLDPGPPPLPEPGTKGEVLGYGICSICFPGYYPGPNTQIPNSPIGEPSSTNSKSKKKCKKKAKASAAKRCKKKRK